MISTKIRLNLNNSISLSVLTCAHYQYHYHEVAHIQKQYTRFVGTWNVRMRTVNSHYLGRTARVRTDNSSDPS